MCHLRGPKKLLAGPGDLEENREVAVTGMLLPAWFSNCIKLCAVRNRVMDVEQQQLPATAASSLQPLRPVETAQKGLLHSEAAEGSSIGKLFPAVLP